MAEVLDGFLKREQFIQVDVEDGVGVFLKDLGHMEKIIPNMGGEDDYVVQIDERRLPSDGLKNDIDGRLESAWGTL